jgi:hypothetical protein
MLPEAAIAKIARRDWQNVKNTDDFPPLRARMLARFQMFAEGKELWRKVIRSNLHLP